MEHQQLVEEVTVALERYRRTLTPGIYLFASEVVEGSSSGHIVEKRSDYTDPAEIEMFGVTFGFWPKGFAPAGVSPGIWYYTHPFLQSVADLVRAPAAFLEQLKLHVEARTAESA
jgi:hypothetical protein